MGFTLRDMYICVHCGEPFCRKIRSSARCSGKYCSIKCQQEHREKKIKRVCENCGKEFYIWPSRLDQNRGRFCSKHCANVMFKGGVSLGRKVTVTCDFCGKPFERHVSRFNKEGKFCTSECYGKWKSLTHPRKGRVRLYYCKLFDEPLRESVRERFGRKCYLCGKSEEDNGRKLDVHHCDYNKSAGCAGHSWSLIPLCHSCHVRTNFKRWYWFARLRDYWVYDYLESFNSLIILGVL